MTSSITIQPSGQNFLFRSFNPAAKRKPPHSKTLFDKISSCNLVHVVGGGISVASIVKLISSIVKRDSENGFWSTYVTPSITSILGLGLMLVASSTGNKEFDNDLKAATLHHFNEALDKQDGSSFFDFTKISTMKNSISFAHRFAAKIYQNKINQIIGTPNTRPDTNEDLWSDNDVSTQETTREIYMNAEARERLIQKHSLSIAKETITSLFFSENGEPFRNNLQSFLTNLNDSLKKINLEVKLRPSHDKHAIEMFVEYRNTFKEPDSPITYQPMFYRRVECKDFISLLGTQLNEPISNIDNSETNEASAEMTQIITRVFSSLFIQDPTMFEGVTSIFSLAQKCPQVKYRRSDSPTLKNLNESPIRFLQGQPWFEDLIALSLGSTNDTSAEYATQRQRESKELFEVRDAINDHQDINSLEDLCKKFNFKFYISANESKSTDKTIQARAKAKIILMRALIDFSFSNQKIITATTRKQLLLELETRLPLKFKESMSCVTEGMTAPDPYRIYKERHFTGLKKCFEHLPEEEVQIEISKIVFELFNVALSGNVDGKNKYNFYIPPKSESSVIVSKAEESLVALNELWMGIPEELKLTMFSNTNNAEQFLRDKLTGLCGENFSNNVHLGMLRRYRAAQQEAKSLIPAEESTAQQARTNPTKK